MSSHNFEALSPRTVMEMPWPERPEHLFLDGMRDLPPEEMDRLRSEQTFARTEEARLRQEMLHAKRCELRESACFKRCTDEIASAVCPNFSVTLTTRHPVAIGGKLSVNTILRFDGMPNEECLPVVLQKNGAHFQDTRFGAYHVFSDSSCDPQSQQPFNKTYVTIRPARGPDGRFLPLPPEDPVSEDGGWEEMKPGDEVECELILELNSNQGWKEPLQVGKDYWLMYGVPHGMSVGAPQIEQWMFGILKDWKGKAPSERGSGYIAIPLVPSNALKFHIDSM